MTDGVYDIAITMEGGTGKAYIKSPVQLTVSGGSMTARVEWSSSKYDLMVIGGEEFLPVNESGNSVFEIPVYTLDEPLSVQAETLAMSEPHMIDYVITFDRSSLPAENGTNMPVIIGGTAVGLAVVAAAVVLLIRKKRNQ